MRFSLPMLSSTFLVILTAIMPVFSGGRGLQDLELSGNGVRCVRWYGGSDSPVLLSLPLLLLFECPVVKRPAPTLSRTTLHSGSLVRSPSLSNSNYRAGHNQ